MTGIFRHLFLPHHTNNFRAKVLHFDFFLLYIAAFSILTFSFRTIHFINPDILGYATDVRIEELLRLTNGKREALGLTTLTFNEQLAEAARQKANYMFAHNFWAHVAPDGTTPWDFVNNSGYVYVVAGENLAKNFSDSGGVLEAWMNSPTHRDNLLRKDYQDIGFAVVNGVLNGEETTLVVQMFGKRLVVNPAPATEPTSGLAGPVSANENVPASQIIKVQPTPATELVIPAQNAGKESIPQFAGSVVRRPLFDMISVSKQTLFWFSLFILIMVALDGVYIWRHRMIRVGGKHMAHILFLFLITGLVWFVSFGSIV